MYFVTEFLEQLQKVIQLKVCTTVDGAMVSSWMRLCRDGCHVKGNGKLLQHDNQNTTL